jgi:hypothetical protein
MDVGKRYDRMLDVGKRYDRMLDEMEFLYQQRREARFLISELIADGFLQDDYGTELLTLLADRVKEGAR